MFIQKKIFVLLPFLFTVHQAIAEDNLLVSNSSQGIHQVYIKASKPIQFTLSVKVGKLQNNLCHYEKETEPQEFKKGGLYKLDGEGLRRIVGKGFQCGATHGHAIISGKEGYEEYLLLSNKKGNYIGTQPSHGEIDLR